MPAEDMEVEMRDGLRAVRSAVDRQAVASIRDAFLFRHLPGYKKHVAGQGLIGGREAVYRRDMLFGDKDIVHRRHRVYIAEDEEFIIAVYQVSRDIAGRDFAEYAIHDRGYQAMRMV